MAHVQVEPIGDAGDHDTFHVHVDDDGALHDYRVTLAHEDADLWADDEESPADVVERCLHLLLEREPATSIMGSFDVRDAVGYFPELETELGRPR